MANQPFLASLFRLPFSTTPELREAVRLGLPFAALQELAGQLLLSLEQVALVVGIPPRTLARRKQAGHLNPQESDRLCRLGHVVSQAAETLGSVEKARAWLKTPNRALSCDTPLDILDTEIGARQVEDALLALTTDSSAEAGSASQSTSCAWRRYRKSIASLRSWP